MTKLNQMKKWTKWLEPDVLAGMFKSARNPSTNEYLAVVSSGWSICSCPGFYHQGYCWHVTTLRHELAGE